MGLRTVSHGVNMPLITIVCSWVFMFLALVAIGIQVFVCVRIRRRFNVVDILLWAAATASLLLVVQTTWAVVVEGQGLHADQDSMSQFDLVAKVQ